MNPDLENDVPREEDNLGALPQLVARLGRSDAGARVKGRRCGCVGWKVW
jgi:hypothetical protein